MDDKERIAFLETELDRAYLALCGYAMCVEHEQPLDAAVRAYHSLTVAAAKRWVLAGAMDGTEHFIGQPVGVLHAALKL